MFIRLRMCWFECAGGRTQLLLKLAMHVEPPPLSHLAGLIGSTLCGADLWRDIRGADA